MKRALIIINISQKLKFLIFCLSIYYSKKKGPNKGPKMAEIWAMDRACEPKILNRKQNITISHMIVYFLYDIWKRKESKLKVIFNKINTFLFKIKHNSGKITR